MLNQKVVVAVVQIAAGVVIGNLAHTALGKAEKALVEIVKNKKEGAQK